MATRASDQPEIISKTPVMEPGLRDIAFAREILGHEIPAGARVLDFGCGIGHAVAALLAEGYDAYGADIVEFWDKDHDRYWAETPKPTQAVAARLRRIERQPYRLPFPDRFFDFCFSDQVLEHVTDYAAVFPEIARVLKPDGISLHRFPGPGRLQEDHIFIPSPFLARQRPYVAAFALLGWRPPNQPHLTWRETVDYTARWMQSCAYLTKRQLRRCAARANVRIAFVERAELKFRGGGRFAPVLHAFSRASLDGPLLAAVSPLLQRYMVLRPG